MFVREHLSSAVRPACGLSEISKIFDLLGWISPVIIEVKIVIQQMWLLNLGWDEQLPTNILDDVTQLFSEFHLLNSIHIPRIIYSTESNITFHGFCACIINNSVCHTLQ